MHFIPHNKKIANSFVAIPLILHNTLIFEINFLAYLSGFIVVAVNYLLPALYFPDFYSGTIMAIYLQHKSLQTKIQYSTNRNYLGISIVAVYLYN